MLPLIDPGGAGDVLGAEMWRHIGGVHRVIDYLCLTTVADFDEIFQLWSTSLYVEDYRTRFSPFRHEGLVLLNLSPDLCHR